LTTRDLSEKNKDGRIPSELVDQSGQEEIIRLLKDLEKFNLAWDELSSGNESGFISAIENLPKKLINARIDIMSGLLIFS
jgi:hypothetical protein